MTVRNLKHLFRPQSVAVIGASSRERSIGAILLQISLREGSQGRSSPAIPSTPSPVASRVTPPCRSSRRRQDLAVICTPPATVSTLIGELGARGYEGGDRVYGRTGRLESASGAQAHAEGKKNMKQQVQHASDAAPFIKPCGHGAERTRDRPPY